MPWNPDPLSDGDAATANSVNSRLEDAAAWINDLTEQALRRGAFNHHHAAVLVPASSPMTVSAEDGILIYEFNTFGVSVDYTTFGGNGGTETAASYSADRAIIGHPDAAAAGSYTGPLAKLSFPGLGHKLGMDQGENVAFLLVRANVQLRKMVPGQAVEEDLEAMVCIQFQLNGVSTWFTVDESESFMSFSDHIIDTSDVDELLDIDIPIATLITPAMITAAGGDVDVDHVTDVRMMCSMVNPDTDARMHIHRWTLTAVPLHAKLS